MQTKINNDMAMGFPGEHANTQPWYADSVITQTALTLGGLVGTDGTNFGAYNSTYTTFAGIAVSPHEHVKMVLPTSDRNLTVAAGTTVSVAKKGAWYIPQLSTAASVGDKLALDATNHTLKVATTDTILEVIAVSDTTIAVRYL